jgi:hypothetical protein
MRVYTFNLPVGDFFLEINTQAERLHDRLVDWYQHAHEPSDQKLGCINIVVTADDYSAYPMYPETKWEGNRCLFSARGCAGWIDAADPITLRVNSNLNLHYVEHFLRVVTAVRVFSLGGLLVHAAGIARNEFGFLFSGHSGAGKTTVCRLSEEFTVLNDDLVILRPTESGWQISATPFTNPTQVRPGVGTVKLHQILHLKQAKRHELNEVPNAKAVADLITHVPVISQSPKLISMLVNRCAQVTQRTEVSELHFLPDRDFWKLI